MHRLSAEQYHKAAKLPLVVVLDNVRSMHNVGSVFRTADAFRLEKVYLCGITAHPMPAAASSLSASQACRSANLPMSEQPALRWADEVHKTALGAEKTVDYAYYADTRDAVRDLKKAGYKIFAVEQVHGSIMMSDIRLCPDERYAIILGHEVFGVQQEVVDMADACLEIPQYGTKHSLNVSVAAGITIYTLATQLRKS